MVLPRTRNLVKMLDERYATLAAEVEEDVADYRDLTPEENDVIVRGLARSAIEILRNRDDFEEVMAETEPPAPDYDALMRRLIARKQCHPRHSPTL